MNSNRNELLFGFSLDSSLSFCIQNKVSGSSLVNEENRHRFNPDSSQISRFNVTSRCQKSKINKIVCVKMYTNLILGRFSWLLSPVYFLST
jgi:hypothetical protein